MRCTNRSWQKGTLRRGSKFQKLVANIGAEKIIRSNKECHVLKGYVKHDRVYANVEPVAIESAGPNPGFDKSSFKATRTLGLDGSRSNS